jgi:hypothetical protein
MDELAESRVLMSESLKFMIIKFSENMFFIVKYYQSIVMDTKKKKKRIIVQVVFIFPVDVQRN